MDVLFEYGVRVTPGAALLVATYLLLRGKQALLLRIALLILGFILVRDVMTPLGMWEFGVTNDFLPWLRFTDDWFVLTVLGITSLALTALVVRLNQSMRGLLVWGKLNARSVGLGLFGAALVAMPFMAAYLFVPIAERGGDVTATIFPALLFMALAGNLMEEVLFRGYLQGYLAKLYTPAKTILLSGLLFAAGHVFLSATVTDLGPVILVFTLYEGLVCAYLRHTNGIIPAAIAHGGAIFLLASGLV